jgi:O-antigen/teichoic acid export membrane protein
MTFLFNNSLFKNGAVNLLLRIIQAALAIIVTSMLTRLLGPKGYGIYAFALAIVTLAALPAQMGMPQLVVRETSKALEDQDWKLIRGLWSWANRTATIISIISFLTVFAIVWFMEPSMRTQTILMALILIPITAFSKVRTASLRGLHFIILSQLPESVVRPIFFMLCLLVILPLLNFFSDIPPVLIMAFFAFSSLFSLFIGATILYLVRPALLIKEKLAKYDPRWKSSIIPLSIITGMQLISNQADIIVLGIFRSHEETGIYRAVFQSALLIIFGLQAIIQCPSSEFLGPRAA